VAPFDAGVLLTTLFFIAALGFFGVRLLLALLNNQPPDLFDLGAGLLLAILIGYAFVRSVRGYRLEGNELVIERLGPGRLRVSLADIASAETNLDLGNFFRAGFLSIQGLFGWAGKAQVRKPTDRESQLIDVYGTNSTSTVLLSLKSEKRIIVTPFDVEGFLNALKESGVGDRPQPVKKGYLPPPRKKRKK